MSFLSMLAEYTTQTSRVKQYHGDVTTTFFSWNGGCPPCFNCQAHMTILALRGDNYPLVQFHKETKPMNSYLTPSI
jgi:hypothetical protein